MQFNSDSCQLLFTIDSASQQNINISIDSTQGGTWSGIHAEVIGKHIKLHVNNICKMRKPNTNRLLTNHIEIHTSNNFFLVTNTIVEDQKFTPLFRNASLKEAVKLQASYKVAAKAKCDGINSQDTYLVIEGGVIKLLLEL